LASGQTDVRDAVAEANQSMARKSDETTEIQDDATMSKAEPTSEQAPAAPAPRRKNIWDMEQEAPKQASGDDPKAQASVGRVRIKTDRSAAEPATPPSGTDRPRSTARPIAADTTPASQVGRVKTRILGFHSDDFSVDALSAAAEPQTETSTFPVGWVVIIDGPGRGTSFTLSAGVSTIGRNADQTVCLDFGDSSVSRENHASIAFDEEQTKFFVGHGGKRNIVRRNGNPVLATEDLSNGDIVKIGKTELKFVAFCGADFAWTDDEDEHADDG
jgi:hypothetical protein